ncbi:Regulator of chromosome condensation (RCC1) repeat [Carpediemonas membranifera]|uniref:Regulator of chromosome condensation (RCC1) repeat n=1 Tax=Carpediemonas membranifera TaxID=201153 RepID=A0A8J6E3D9_9EUKA|nr:Regulator of chromosome condensation (RCC1) repeat [Carpediemonas membranifera]|eukprot:KAG9395798.1 Regulator of chromosome condensation (RCC1) repeat [Carpediemonas membranifera]
MAEEHDQNTKKRRDNTFGTFSDIHKQFLTAILSHPSLANETDVRHSKTTTCMRNLCDSEQETTILFEDAEQQSSDSTAPSVSSAGPDSSMNILLADGEDLPIRLHTLLQATIWAVLLEAGADPDIADPSNSANALWFLCRKFLFTREVAQKDCFSSSIGEVYFKLYAGRLFARNDAFISPSDRPGYRSARVPPVIAFRTYAGNTTAVTARGVYSWGNNSHGSLGLPHTEPAYPTRVRFDSFKRVSDREKGLPSWHKDALITEVLSNEHHTILVTEVGLMVAGGSQGGIRPQECPHAFTPTHMTPVSHGAALLIQGNVAMVFGHNNDFGQLGLGHTESVQSFTPLDFPVSRSWFMKEQTLYLSGTTFLYAGMADSIGTLFLPGLVEEIALSPTPLVMPGPVKACFIGAQIWVFVRSDGQGSFGARKGVDGVKSFEISEEVTEVRAKGASAWLNTAAGWHGVGYNGSGCLGRAVPMWMDVPTLVMRRTPQFEAAGAVEVVHV